MVHTQCSYLSRCALAAVFVLASCAEHRQLPAGPSPATDSSQGGAGGRGGAQGGIAGTGGQAGQPGQGGQPAGAGGSGSAPAEAPDARADSAGAADTSADQASPPAPDAAPASALASCPGIVAAATSFVDSLEAAKKPLAVMPFAARKHYIFTPEPTRPGLPLKNMTEAQQGKAFALLKASLSDSGYEKAMLIRTMDNWLKANVGGLPFSSVNYYVAIYGTPSPAGNWAWHWEGHHASLHFTFAGCTRAASTPMMFGVEPAKLANAFEGAPAGTRVLGKQEDLARALATLLAADPTKKATAIAAKGGRMLPNTPAKQGPQNPPGLAAASMNPAETEKLKELLAEVAGNVNPELAALRMKKVQEAGFDKVAFLWVGPLAASTNAIYYFRVQGPTFIFEHNIEWENHVHSAWRDFDGDFGEDLLQQHLKAYPHQSAALYGADPALEPRAIGSERP